MTPKRVIGNRCSSALSVCPSCLNSSSSKLRRVGSARALNTASMPLSICDLLVTYQGRRKQAQDALAKPGGLADGCRRCYTAGAGAADRRPSVKRMLTITTQIPDNRNAKKPAGVNDAAPITTPAQPSHFGKPP